MNVQEALRYKDELVAEEARHKRRKQLLAKTALWIMVAPLFPVFLMHVVAENIRESRFALWYLDRVHAFADRHGVDLSS